MKLMALHAQSCIYHENRNYYYYFCMVAVRLLNKVFFLDTQHDDHNKLKFMVAI